MASEAANPATAMLPHKSKETLSSLFENDQSSTKQAHSTIEDLFSQNLTRKK